MNDAKYDTTLYRIIFLLLSSYSAASDQVLLRWWNNVKLAFSPAFIFRPGARDGARGICSLATFWPISGLAAGIRHRNCFQATKIRLGQIQTQIQCGRCAKLKGINGCIKPFSNAALSCCGSGTADLFYNSYQKGALLRRWRGGLKNGHIT